MTTIRTFAGAASLNGELYIVGGQQKCERLSNPTTQQYGTKFMDVYHSSVEKYNPELESWTMVAPLPFP